MEYSKYLESKGSFCSLFLGVLCVINFRQDCRRSGLGPTGLSLRIVCHFVLEMAMMELAAACGISGAVAAAELVIQSCSHLLDPELCAGPFFDAKHTSQSLQTCELETLWNRGQVTRLRLDDSSSKTPPAF